MDLKKKDIIKDQNIGVNSLWSAHVSHYFNKLINYKTLQNHYLKNDVSLMGDKEPELQQQKI
jgi:hypothetical protein